MKRISWKITALVLSLGLLPWQLMAQQRTQSQALSVAKATFEEEAHRQVGALTALRGNLLELKLSQRVSNTAGRRQMPSFATDDRQPFYIFNDEEKGGFVIVAGDERMGDILGYSETGCMDLQRMPDALVALLTQYAQAYAEASKSYVAPSQPSKVKWTYIAPMIKTQWGQDTPYNLRCPLSGGKQCIVGCGATAMAQIMNYYKYPEHGKGTMSYTTKTLSISQSLNFENLVFQWDKMKKYYYSNDSDTEACQAVAQLSHACGVSIGMDYTPTASNSFTSDVPYALIQIFDYNPNINYRDRTYYSQNEWLEMLYNELSEKRPVLYRGADENETSGHLFVADGCNARGLIHFNWGWYGNCDGFFNLSSMLPDTENPSMDYSYGHCMVTGIQPEEQGEHEDVFHVQRFTATKNGTRVDMLLEGCYCYVNTTTSVSQAIMFSGYIGVGLFDLKTNQVVDVPARFQASLPANYGWKQATLYFYPGALSNQVGDGIYGMHPVVVNTEGEITPIHLAGGLRYPVYLKKEGTVLTVLDELPSAIVAPQAAKASDAQSIFSMDGRRVTTPRSGQIYVKQGRKVLVR